MPLQRPEDLPWQGCPLHPRRRPGAVAPRLKLGYALAPSRLPLNHDDAEAAIDARWCFTLCDQWHAFQTAPSPPPPRPPASAAIPVPEAEVPLAVQPAQAPCQAGLDHPVPQAAPQGPRAGRGAAGASSAGPARCQRVLPLCSSDSLGRQQGSLVLGQHSSIKQPSSSQPGSMQAWNDLNSSGRAWLQALSSMGCSS